MPLKIFRCPYCGFEKRVISKEQPHCRHGLTENDPNFFPSRKMKEVLTAPESKMMETTDRNMGKSKIKGLTKILKERSRNYARDFEATDLVNFNKKNGIEKSGFLGKDGKLRKRIDDK